jgi:hypothetical protein
MRLKVIKVQWSYSEELESLVDKFMAKLKEEQAFDIDFKFLYTDSFCGVSFTWRDNDLVPATPKVVKASPKKN